MIGAIIGDLAGSVYEFKQTKIVKGVCPKKLIKKDCFFSDDTILLIAIANAILTDGNYEKSLKQFAKKYENSLPKFGPYFKTMFSPNFLKWVHGSFEGTSCGNGAMMRIAPVGFLFDTEKQVEENVRLATICSHNSAEAIECATIVAKFVYFARKGLSKQEIFTKLDIVPKEVKITEFNYRCKTTLDVCLFAISQANSFEDSIKKVLKFGGDTDTNACIVGAMAEALFGVPQKLKEEAAKHLPQEFVEILKKCYKKTKDKSEL